MAIIFENSRGANSRRAILTEKDVREIRELAASGMTNAEIARRKGICYQHVGRIVKRLAWQDTP